MNLYETFDIKESTYTLIEEMLLIEGRMEFLKNNFKDKLSTSHDTQATAKTSDAIIDHFADKADPTKKKTNTQWILNQYKDGKIRQEDHPRINTALSGFEAHKAKLEKKDLNQYGSLSDVEDAVEPHLGTAVSKKAEVRQVKADGADKIYDDDKISVYHVKSKEAACSYGAGTKWCTAADSNNMFDHYNNDGNIHVVMEKGNNRKFQYHVNSNQFMDEKDHDIGAEDKARIMPSLHKAWEKHPQLLD